MRKRRITVLNNKYMFAYRIKINKETKVILPSKITLMEFWPVNEMIDFVSYLFIFNFTYPLTCTGLLPGVRVLEVEHHSYSWYNFPVINQAD
jgi:hypothetical protein